MSSQKSVIALGFFDGVHLAHKEIISYAVKYAEKHGLCAIALTFDASPRSVLSEETFHYITTNTQKESIIASLGAKVEFITADKEFFSLSPDEFVSEILVKKYNVQHAVCGYNYRFGKGGAGNTDTLGVLGKRYGFTTKICNRVTIKGESVSSSRIRDLITHGNVEEASLLLGRHFLIEGTVSEGKHLGRTIGFPTANVFLEKNTVFPKSGVYKTIATVQGKRFDAITNVGVNPTVGTEALRAETYISAFSENLYGEKIQIEFVSFLRPERKFESIDELKKQIEKDIENSGI